MLNLRNGEWFLILFNLAYVIAFATYYISIKNYEFLWYIAGPPGMVAEMRNILFLNKVNTAKILTEEFDGY